MFEEDEGVFPFLILHTLHPFNQIARFVISFPQTQVSPISRADDFGQRLLVSVRNDERAILCPQRVERPIVKPTLMAELERGALVAGEQIQEVLQSLSIFLRIWWKLK